MLEKIPLSPHILPYENIKSAADNPMSKPPKTGILIEKSIVKNYVGLGFECKEE